MAPSTRAVLTFLALAGASTAGTAQTLWGIESMPASGPPRIVELARLADPLPCGVPDPMLLTTIPVVVPPSCTALFPDVQGDVAIDRERGVLYAGTRNIVARYSLDGTFQDTFSVGMTIQGMCVNPNTGRIWVTDGGVCATFVPPPVPACGQLVPMASWLLTPIAAGWFSSVLTDLDFDRYSGTLVGCDRAGVVGSFLPQGIPMRGPYPFRQVSGVCGLGIALTGIAMDHGRPGSGIYWVTDGTTIAYLQPDGTPAPPTPYAPTACVTVPSGSLAGLAYLARPVPYGQGSDTRGLPPPTIGAVGEALVPSSTFAFTLSGSVPGAGAMLVYGSRGAACPPHVVGGLSLLAQPPVYCLGTAAVDGNGAATLVTPVAATVPLGFTGWVQWLVATPTPSLQTSNAMQLSFSTR